MRIMSYKQNISIKRQKLSKKKKKNQIEILELKNVTEMKQSLKGLNSRFEQARKRISNLKDRLIKIIESEEQKEKRMRTNEQSFRDLWNTP